MAINKFLYTFAGTNPNTDFISSVHLSLSALFCVAALRRMNQISCGPNTTRSLSAFFINDSSE
jgi:hypothetical protein